MFCGWRINGNIQQEPPPEFWDKLDNALRDVLGITIYGDEQEDEDNQIKAG